MPVDAKFVGRQTVYGNPYSVLNERGKWSVGWSNERGYQHMGVDSQAHAHVLAVQLYGLWLHGQPELAERVREELAGRDLVCWCAPELACHADVLLAVVRGEEP